MCWPSAPTRESASGKARWAIGYTPNMSIRDESGTKPQTKADEPIGEIAAAIAREPKAPKLDAPATKPTVAPIGEIESAIERSGGK